MAFEVQWQPSGVVIVYKGKITLEDLAKATEAIYHDQRYDSCRYQIADFEQADISTLSIDQVQAIAASDADMSRMLPDMPSAIVTQQANGIALAFHYKMIAEAHHMQWEVKVFSSMAEARIWQEGLSLTEQSDR